MATFGGSNIVKNGLVLHLDAANQKSYRSGGTTWFDLSGQNNHGALTNGPTFNSSNGGSIVFDGVNDYIAEPYTSLLDIGTQFSVTSFVKMTNISNNVIPIFSSTDIEFSVRTRGFYIYRLKTAANGVNPNSICFQFGQNSWRWNVYCSNQDAIIDTNWHYISITANGLNTSTPTIKFYIDGLDFGSNYWTGAPKGAIIYSQSTQSPRIGSIYFPANPSYDGGPYYLNGSISYIQLYNRALSASEVLQNYNATKGRFNL